MLIGIDHITLATDDIEKYSNIFYNVGYKKHIHVQNIPNIKLKKNLLSHYAETQSFYIMKKQGNLNIEIIKDSSKLNGKSCYIPLYKNSSLNGICVKVHNKDIFIKQWESIGFKHSGNILHFTSFGNTYTIKPILANKNTYFLDNKGFVCISLISTSICDDYNDMQKNGFLLSSIDYIEVNNKLLQLFFAKGANGELLEIIGLDNAKRN